MTDALHQSCPLAPEDGRVRDELAPAFRLVEQVIELLAITTTKQED